MLSFPKLDAQRSLEIIQRQEREGFPSYFPQPWELSRVEYDTCSAPWSPGMVCWCRWRDKKPPSNCKSLWAEEASLEEERCPVEVGLALGSGDEERGVTCSILLGSTGSPSHQRVCTPALIAEQLQTSATKWTNTAIFWQNDLHSSQYLPKLPLTSLPGWSILENLQKVTLEDGVGACCREDSLEGVGRDVLGVCPARGCKSQGFQRAHHFLGSTQHLTGSGLHTLCRAPY